MSRFNSEAYDKLFPRTPDPVPAAETAVEGFTPTKDKIEGKDPDKTPEPDPEPAPAGDLDPTDNGGGEDGNGQHGEPDPE